MRVCGELKYYHPSLYIRPIFAFYLGVSSNSLMNISGFNTIVILHLFSSFQGDFQ